jgi:hypothetical protein
MIPGIGQHSLPIHSNTSKIPPEAGGQTYRDTECGLFLPILRLKPMAIIGQRKKKRILRNSKRQDFSVK